MTVEQICFDHVTHKNPDSISFKSKISQQYFVAIFLEKMILAKTSYKIDNQKLLAIIEVFKTWHYYLKGCKYKVFILIDYNNLQQFIDTKNLSSRQVYQAQQLSWYHFCIDYCWRKVNRAIDILFQFSQKSLAEEKILRNENTHILHYLQTSLTKASLSKIHLSGLSSTANLLLLY